MTCNIIMGYYNGILGRTRVPRVSPPLFAPVRGPEIDSRAVHKYILFVRSSQCHNFYTAVCGWGIGYVLTVNYSFKSI